MIKLRGVMPDDCLLDLDISADQYKFGVDPKSMLKDALTENKNVSSRFLVICNDEVPVGMIEYCAEERLQCYNILYLFIDHRCQEKGYAYEALRLLIDKLIEDGEYGKVSVTLYENNVTARKLYDKIGFVPNGFSFEDEYDMEMSFR